MLLDSLLGKRCRACGNRSRLQRLGDLPSTSTAPLLTSPFDGDHEGGQAFELVLARA